MKKVENEDLKKICNSVLRSFKDYCKTHHLTFYLAAGTALGAVRHKGFIPWDDDIDIIMPRPDYEKLMRMYNDEEGLCLLCHERDKMYFYPFAKLCDKNTILIEKHYSNDRNMGIYIDIFPLDGDGSDRNVAERHLLKCIKTQRKLNIAMAKHFFRSDSNLIKETLRHIRYFAIKMIGSKYYYYKLDSLIKKYRYEDSKYICINSWCFYGLKELFDKKLFDKTIDIAFEGEYYPILANYDFYLSSLYGDYMKPPPKEKRVSHHDMQAYYKHVE